MLNSYSITGVIRMELSQMKHIDPKSDTATQKSDYIKPQVNVINIQEYTKNLPNTGLDGDIGMDTATS